ncbi:MULTISPECIES: VanZ family protein [unclassified Microbacterium]|uniref:VanZ family protein n=1 Tax=unclassified Microbacterium TaxID=2609290 RepID=UPI0014023748|nr:VanZ family protein [Microbacterium sp. Gd 4-13]
MSPAPLIEELGARTRTERWRRTALLALVVYGVAVLLIAFWPVPVDSGAVGLLDRIERLLPWATYGRIEVAANVVFFVPLGFLLSLVLEHSRYLVLPIGLLTTIAIEGLQAELLDERTASISDVLANTAGTCIGILVAAAIIHRRDVDPPGRRKVAG